MNLGNNQVIDILLTGIKSIDGDLISSIPFSFSTTFDPLYSSPNKVRAVAGSYISDVSDEMLLYLIHNFSVQAEHLAVCDIEKNPKWKYYASQWVTYNTALEAVMNSNNYIGSSGQKVYKKLGDFSISKDATGKDASPSKGMIDKLECEILKLSVAVKFCKEPLTSCDKSLLENSLYVAQPAQLVTKGGNLPRPAFGRTFLADGTHPGITGHIKILDKFRITNSQGRALVWDDDLSNYRYKPL